MASRRFSTDPLAETDVRAWLKEHQLSLRGLARALHREPSFLLRVIRGQITSGPMWREIRAYMVAPKDYPRRYAADVARAKTHPSLTPSIPTGGSPPVPGQGRGGAVHVNPGKARRRGDGSVDDPARGPGTRDGAWSWPGRDLPITHDTEATMYVPPNHTRIRATRSFAYAQESFRVGDVLVLDTESANRLIQSKDAVPEPPRDRATGQEEDD